MKQRTTAGFMAVFAGVLLATMTSVYANHAATGKGTYAVAHNVLAEFHFVVANPVAKRGPNPALQPGLNFVQSEMARSDGSKSFQTFMISTAIAPLEISTEDAGRTVTITGQLVSTTFLGEGEERQPSAELVSFKAIGVDTVTTGAGPDLFSLIVEYSLDKDQGPLFRDFEFGNCDEITRICTITFTGEVKTGNVFVHTTGGD